MTTARRQYCQILNWILIWNIVSCLINGSPMIVNTYHERKEVSNREYSVRKLFQLNGIRGVALCAGQCTRNVLCASFFYNKESQTCTGHSTVFIGPRYRFAQADRNKYYVIHTGNLGDACHSDADCNFQFSYCHYSRCLCQEGNSYSFKDRSCVQSCKLYGRYFQEVPYYFIDQHNMETLTGISFEDCQMLCLNRTSYTCKSFEYGDTSKECFLQNITRQDAIADWNTDQEGLFSYYQRHCS
ncbi:hypothetical protein ACJMK2_023960 [Sinanodonta woodiana]|uniref:Apple domain-containing protein n=1 Tax=Sinanodonta woodiana TaxID=1069815 RepID=A0ABD3T6Q2_SINWO